MRIPPKISERSQKLFGTADRIMATLDKCLLITILLFDIPCIVRIRTSNTLWMKKLIKLDT